MQQVDSSERGRQGTLSSPVALPQFDLPTWEASDPDRTLERLPALSADSTGELPTQVAGAAYVPPPSSSDVVTAAAVYASAHDLDADMARTVELVPEITASDILAEVVAKRKAAPPLVLPPPATAPIDLNRLLARAHAEASRSPDFFHPAGPPSIPAAPSTPAPSSAIPFELVNTPTPFALTTAKSASTTTSIRLADMLEPDQTMSLARAHNQRASRRLGWAVGMVCAVAAVSVGIALGQARTSSARIAPVAISKTVAPVPAAKSASDIATAKTNATAISAPLAQSVAATSLPRVEAGTISLAAVAASHRLFIDGKVAEGGTSVVTCGRHLVQVGSRGTRHYVEVPCGEEVILDR